MGAGLIELLDDRWRAWIESLDQIPRDRLAEPGVCGHWSAKDLVGHVALWDEEVLTDIERWRLGLSLLANDWQRMNDDDHAAKRETPFDLLRVQMYAAHGAIRREVQDLPDDIPGDIRERIAFDTWEHYPEHTSDLLDWLEKNGFAATSCV